MLRHIVTDLHEAYLKEFEAKIKPEIGKSSPSAPPSEKSEGGGAPDDKLKKQAKQLAYDTRYKARREDIPLERAWSQVLQNSSASAPVKELAKGMVFGGGVKKEELELGEGKTSSGASGKKDMVLVTPAKGFGKPYRRYADLKKKYELRKNPQIQSVVGTAYGSPYEGEKRKGEQTKSALQHKQPEKKAKKDYDGDGKIESGTDEWKGSRDKAIKKSVVKKSQGIKEGYSSWRNDLREVMDVLDKEKSDKKVSEKKVNNKIIISPPLKEAIQNIGGQIIEVEEINEDYLYETVDIATEYFFNQGLNEEGLDIVIEELGLEKFTDFVFYVAEDYELTEARRSGRIEPVTKSGKSIGSLKGGAKASAIKAKQKEKAARNKTDDRPSGMTAALKSQSSVAKKVTTDRGKKSVEKAKSSQSSKKPVRDAIARGIFGAVKAYQSGMERHKKAMGLAKETGKTVAKAAKVTHEAGRRAGETKVGQAVKKSAAAAGKAVAKKVKSDIETTKKALKKEEIEIDEAVYGGVKPEPKDTRMTVTASDKKANTKAWQNYKAGHKGYKAADHLQNEAKKMKGEDPCWKGYQMVGTKKKGGKEVPNCVPEEAKNPYAIGMAAAMKSTGDKPPLKKSTITKAHKIAKKVDEAISTVTGQQGNQVSGKQQDTEQKQTKNAQAKLTKILAARKNLQSSQQQAIRSGVTNIGASFELEGDLVDEARAEEKRGLGSTGTQRQRQKTKIGGIANPSTSYSGGQNPQLRGKQGKSKEERRSASRRYVDQPGGIYAKPENKQGEGRYAAKQAKKRPDLGSRYD
jgi:hypothetical protein